MTQHRKERKKERKPRRYGNRHYLIQRREFVAILLGRKIVATLLGTTNLCFLLIFLTTMTLQLLRFIKAHVRGYGRPNAAKGLRFCSKVLKICTTILGLALPSGVLTSLQRWG
jgi:hypothetical protein